MLLADFVCNVKILTVLKLSWEKSDDDAAPRNFHALSFRTSGNAQYTVGASKLDVHDGDLLFIPQNVGYHIKASREELYAIHFELPEKTQNYIEIFSVWDYAKTRNLFEICYETWSRKEPGYYFKTLSVFYKIMETIFVSSNTAEDDKIARKLERATNYLHANYTDPALSVITICNIAHISDTWFRKLFVKRYGIKPLTYINTLRVDNAKELLASGYYKVESVARLSGFEDPKYFCTLFKQYTGLSPSQYRNNSKL